jgi:hypothetical protein
MLLSRQVDRQPNALLRHVVLRTTVLFTLALKGRGAREQA